MPTNIAIRLQAEGGADIKRAFDDAGRSGQAAFDGVAASMDRAGAASDKVTEKVRQAGEAARAAQSSAGGSGGTSSPAVTREVERIRTQLDEEYRRQKQLDRAETVIGRGQTSGAFDAAEAERLRGLASRKYGSGNDNDPSRAGLSSYDKMFIRYQGFDVASSLGSGASPTTVAFQQSPQILQQLADREGGLKAGLSQLGESAKGLVTPFTVAGAAVTGAAALFTLAAVSYQRDQSTLTRSLQTTGRTTDATVSQLDALARNNAEAGKVSSSTAREIVAAYANTGEIGTSVMDGLIQRTGDYARITGQDVPSATAELARMFADPAKGAEDLGNKLGGVDDKTRQYIITLAEQGDRTSAQIALSEAFRAQIKANADATSNWGTAWNFVASTADKAWESIKRVAGASVTTPQQALADLNERYRNAQQNSPDSTFTRNLKAERDAKQAEVDRAQQEADQRAATERAVKDSVAAGSAARSLDPQFSRLSEINRQQAALRAGLDNPDARTRMDEATIDAAERASAGLKRARESMLDTNGKLITSEELVRRQDELSVEAAKATTAAEKAAVAEKQKQLELLGKTVSPTSATQQIATAGTLARLAAASKGGSDADTKDEYDRATKSIEDRIRRQGEEATTYGMSADAVARYRTQTELLTAVKRAERDITPALTKEIADYTDRSAEAAQRVEDLRDKQRTTDQYRGAGSDGLRTLLTDLGNGKSLTDAWADAATRLRQRFLDMAADNVVDAIFGKRGSSSTGLLGELFSSGGASSTSTASLSSFFSGSFFPGFADGGSVDRVTRGFTGMGGRYEPAGVVHRGEYVFDQTSVDRIGVGTLDAMRRGVRGFAEGGYTMPSTAAMRGASGAGAGTGGAAPVEVHVHNAPTGTEVTHSNGPRGPRLDIQIDNMVASALLGGSSTRGALKKLRGNGLRG